MNPLTMTDKELIEHASKQVQALRMALDMIECEKYERRHVRWAIIDALKEEAAAQPAPVQKRPQNCGTGYCSCIECVMEPAPVQEPVAILNHAHGVYAFRSVNLQGLPDGEYQVYTTPLAQPAPVDDEKLAALGWQAIECGICGGGAMGYPQRTWVVLTPEETDDIIANAIDKVDALIQTADKLKEKNT